MFLSRLIAARSYGLSISTGIVTKMIDFDIMNNLWT